MASLLAPRALRPEHRVNAVLEAEELPARVIDVDDGINNVSLGCNSATLQVGINIFLQVTGVGINNVSHRINNVSLQFTSAVINSAFSSACALSSALLQVTDVGINNVSLGINNVSLQDTSVGVIGAFSSASLRVTGAGINNVSLRINNVSHQFAPAGINNVSLKNRSTSFADAIAGGGGLVRVQSVVDRTAQVLRVERRPCSLVPGTRDMGVSPLTSQAVKSLPHQGRADGNSPWLQDRLARLRLHANGAAVNINRVELQILEHGFHRLIFPSLAMARPFEGHGTAAGDDSTPKTSEGADVVQ